MSSSRIPGPDGAGVGQRRRSQASGAVALIGCPPTIRLLATDALDVRVVERARRENRTSADVNGVPSDQATPWRRCSV